jgi:Regulator of Chromosome Condensation (RCC1) repeat protein
MRSLGQTVQATLAALLAAAALAGCGDTLVDHRATGIAQGPGGFVCQNPSLEACTIDGQNVCKPDGVGPDKVCGHGCQPCLAGSAPQNSTAACNLTPDKTDHFCDWNCNDGLLKTATGCSPPALVAAGGSFSCATTVGTGEVHCWGANDQGQLGPGEGASSRSTSGKVQSPLLLGVSALAAGPAHACAVVGTTTYCWGDATGFSGIVSGSLPVDVPALSGVITLSAGAKHTCGATGTGTLKCTGAAVEGGGSPTLGGTLLDFAAGDSFSCALVNDGSPTRSVKCWGADNHGQRTGLGVPGSASPNLATIPLTPAAGLVFTHVAAGATHACASTSGSNPTDPVLFCWGDDTLHQTGVNGTGGTAVGPVASKINKPIGTGLTVFDAGGATTCALENDTPNTTVQCWGGDPIAAGGGAGLGELLDLLNVSPTPPGAFSVGGDHGCWVQPTGTLACWGHGSQGQLGNDATADAPLASVLVVDR